MKKLIKRRIIKIITSNEGIAVYIVMFVFLPLILLVPAIAIDFSAYMAARTQLQNALDISSVTALNLSTRDNYRADKEISVIFDMSSDNAFAKKLVEGMNENLKMKVAAKVVNTNASTNESIIGFTPDTYLTASPAVLTITPTQTGMTEYVETSSGSNTDFADANNKSDVIYGSDYAIEMDIKTVVDLPVYKKVTDLFNLGFNKDMFKVPLVVKSAIRGVRIKSYNDFNEYSFEKQE